MRTQCNYHQRHPRTGEKINQCQRTAEKGWTTCKRHHSAGNARKAVSNVR